MVCQELINIKSKIARMFGIRDEDEHKNEKVKVLLKKKDRMHRDKVNLRRRAMYHPKKAMMDSPEKCPAEKAPNNEDGSTK
jgi:hypothetical protein